MGRKNTTWLKGPYLVLITHYPWDMIIQQGTRLPTKCSSPLHINYPRDVRTQQIRYKMFHTTFYPLPIGRQNTTEHKFPYKLFNTTPYPLPMGCENTTGQKIPYEVFHTTLCLLPRGRENTTGHKIPYKLFYTTLYPPPTGSENTRGDKVPYKVLYTTVPSTQGTWEHNRA